MNPERKPSKPPPPPIIEQFRSRLRERERLGPVGTLDVVSLYEEALVELNRNSKPVISGLSFIAGEQREHAEGIATVICDRILKVPKEQKLPSLYLLDSIVKNVGSEYLRYFAARLPEVFLQTYWKLNSSFHPAMLHLFRTWLPYFPSLVLGKIEVSLHENQKPASSGDLRHSGSQSPRLLPGNDVNLKYLGVQHQSDHFAVDARRTIPPRLEHEVLSSRPGFESVGPAVMGAVEDILPYPRPSSPTRIGLRIDVDRASLSGIGSGRTSDGNGALARSWPSGDGEENVEASGAHNNDNGPDKLRARYLIDAYGGKNSSHEKPPKFQRLCFAGTSSDVAAEDMRSSGEEFVLETMSPTLSSQSKRYSPMPFGYNTGLTRSNAPYLGNDFESDQDNRAFLPRFDDPASITRANQPSFLARHQFDADDRTNLNSVSLYEITPPNTPPFQPSLHTFRPLHVPPLHPVPHHPVPHHPAAAAAPHPSATLPPAAVAPLPPAAFTPYHPAPHPFNSASALPPAITSSCHLPSISPPVVTRNDSLTFFPPGGPLPPPPPCPPSASTQIRAASESASAVISDSPANVYSSLIGSLLAQGLIKLIPPNPSQDAVGMDFNAEFLKVRHESSINALYGDLSRQCTTCGMRFKSQEEHSSHMNWHMTENRIAKNHMQNPSSNWYLSAREWLNGAAAL